MPSRHAYLVQATKAHNLASWTAQKDWRPLSMVRAEGVYFWDADEVRYLDWSSQVFNVNVGHAHPRLVEAIQEQAARLSTAGPGMATEARARLGVQLADVTPQGLNKAFFTLGGSDANENAIKMARLVTGRQKIIARYRAYHGATFGALSAGGDPRGLPNEPGVPWVVHVHDPYPYRSPLYRGRSPEEGDRLLADLIEETILFEGPDNVAAILLEGYSGTSGIIQGGPVFWERIGEICKAHGILLIADEVLSGFGRTGAWFGVDHYPGVRPDLLVMAKGLTSGYVPLGAVMVSDTIASHFEDHTLWAGLTYHAHPLACAAASANIEILQEEGLVDRARDLGRVLRAGLVDLAERHPSVGDVRGAGLQQVVELVSDRSTREPLSPFNRPFSPAMRAVIAALRENGLSTYVRWNLLFSAPPLIVSEGQLEEGLEALDRALDAADEYAG